MKTLDIIWIGFVLASALSQEGKNEVSDVPEICLPYVQKTVTRPEKKCFINAECIFGELLNHTSSDSQTNCLNHCQRTENCKWFTFDPTLAICLTYSECIEFHPTSQCPDCVSGEPDCIKCSIQNSRCYGRFIDKVAASSPSECLNLCRSRDGCNHITFYSLFSGCVLLQDCPRIDNCKSCISSNVLCQENETGGNLRTQKQQKTSKTLENPFSNSTKLLIATGYSYEWKTVEIIDLALSKKKCENLPYFPVKISDAFGTLGLTNNPLICGGVRSIDDGLLYENTCTTFENGTWKSAASLNVGRGDAAITKSDSTKTHLKIVVASDGTAEELTSNGWKTVLPNIPFTFENNCIRHFNSTTLILVSGEPQTYFLSTEKEVWEKMSSAKFKRSEFTCARIKSNNHTLSYNIIVVEGKSSSYDKYVFRTKYLTSTEILDVDTNVWRNGPDLPFGIADAALVEDSTGGVILVGGSSKNESYLNTLFRLPNADAQWEEMPQKLVNGRRDHVAFLVPEEITNCTVRDD